MATATETKNGTQPQEPKQRENLPAIGGPRLPFHPAVEERFGIDRASWKALVEAIFPNAVSVESVILALSYCRARKLDPFKRNVHIVPIWNKEIGGLVDTIWPGIGELRTTAFRTGEYAGRSETEFGKDITAKVGNVELTYPEWARVSVFRMIKGQRVEFSGPRVYWLETYATYKRNDDTPNEMWRDRPRGQIDKCAEAAALRAAFPEEIGGDYAHDEIRPFERGGVVLDQSPKPVQGLSQLTAALDGAPATQVAATEPDDPPQLDQSETDVDPADLLADIKAEALRLADLGDIAGLKNMQAKYLGDDPLIKDEAAITELSDFFGGLISKLQGGGTANSDEPADPTGLLAHIKLKLAGMTMIKVGNELLAKIDDPNNDAPSDVKAHSRNLVEVKIAELRAKYQQQAKK